MKRNVYLLTIGFLFKGLTVLNAQQSVQYAALSQSVLKNEANYAQNFGTFRTMESLSYDEKTSSMAVTVKVIQPICDGQKGSLALVNPSGADWTYKVMSKKGSFVGEGAVGYNRKVGELKPDIYLVQFTLPDGTSAIDEFTIRKPEGIKASIEKHHANKYLPSNEVTFVGISSGANEFVWDFGDGSKLEYGKASVIHKYSNPGIYQVKFTANNWDCQESAVEEITISGPVAFDKSEY